MPAPVAKGIIVVTSILVAVGIAIYENPEVRAWIERSRRKVAVALHSLGDEIQPGWHDRVESSRHGASAEDERRRRRESMARRNREAILRSQRNERGACSSFDALVNEDGSLRDEHEGRSTATKREEMREVVRRRTEGARGLDAGAYDANPFADEQGQVLFDQTIVDTDELQKPSSAHIAGEGSAKVEAESTYVAFTTAVDLAEFREATEYVQVVKACYADQPERYRKFLELLHAWQRGSTPHSELLGEVTKLFASEPDLVNGFKHFMPTPRTTAGSFWDARDYNAIAAVSPSRSLFDANGTDASSQSPKHGVLVDLDSPDPPVSVPQPATPEPLAPLLPATPRLRKSTQAATSEITGALLPEIPASPQPATQALVENPQPATPQSISFDRGVTLATVESSLLPAPQPVEAPQSTSTEIRSSSSVYQSFTSSRSPPSEDTLSLQSAPSDTQTVSGAATPISRMSTTPSFANLADAITGTHADEEHEDSFSDVMSDVEGISTPSSWTDVGSEVWDSEDEGHRQRQ